MAKVSREPRGQVAKPCGERLPGNWPVKLCWIKVCRRGKIQAEQAAWGEVGLKGVPMPEKQNGAGGVHTQVTSFKGFVCCRGWSTPKGTREPETLEREGLRDGPEATVEKCF